MPVVVETTREFAERHGGNSIRVGSAYLFPDGAECDDLGTRREPPTDPTALLKQRKRYVAAKLKVAEEVFHATRSDFSQQAGFAMQNRDLPPPPADAKEHLLALKETVMKWRAQLTAIEEQLAQTPEAIQRQRMQDQLNERAQRISLLRQDVLSVTLD